MSQICGECMKPYSLKCQIQKQCHIHNTQCFSCRQCSTEQTLFQCLSCGKLCQQNEAYYHVGCDGYLCRNELPISSAQLKEIRLLCGCRELKEHIDSFVSSFCYKCKRKIVKKDNSNKLTYCQVCRLNTQCKPADRLDDSKFQSKKMSESQHYIQQGEKYSQQQEQIDLDQLSLSYDSKVQTQNQSSSQSNSNKRTIQELKSLVASSTTELHLSEFMRMQFRTVMHNERDYQCPFCIMPFSLTRRPMMVCLQQHLLCEDCLNNHKNIRFCPLCREQIHRQKVSVHREGMRILEIQKYFNENVASKYRRFDIFKKENKSDSPQYVLADSETQTILTYNNSKAPKLGSQARSKRQIVKVNIPRR